VAPPKYSLFGPFRFDSVNECLWRGKQPISLTPKAFAMLRYLVEHPGRLVTKGELSLQSRQVEDKSKTSLKQVNTSQDKSAVRSLESEAEKCFHKAIAIARRQEAKPLELRAVMSLSRLWQQQGKKKKARQMLAEIYGWFTEGFDTADLQEARALLEKLA
jgi:hypothetical protein